MPYDCSKRGDIVLDPFGGSGSTLIAAEKTGRKARLIEFDPIYCDVIVRRFEQLTGKQAKLEFNGESFELIAESRAEPIAASVFTGAPDAEAAGYRSVP